MDITVLMVAYIGIHMIEILMVDNIVAITDITTTQEKDKAVCHTKDSKTKNIPILT
mgnify:CR=1 FL=1